MSDGVGLALYATVSAAGAVGLSSWAVYRHSAGQLTVDDECTIFLGIMASLFWPAATVALSIYGLWWAITTPARLAGKRRKVALAAEAERDRPLKIHEREIAESVVEGEPK